MGPVLTEPITLAGRTAPARVMFGPHRTNLGDGRALSADHVAYYERRARGGAGIIVTETASVHHLDQRYERAPLADACEVGWARTVAACRPHGSLVLAGIGHSGLQGSSAWTQAPLWGPSRVPDPATRELPMEMTSTEIRELIAGFDAAAEIAVNADVDGVELDAGPLSLLRQFLSGLTNQRTDIYGRRRDRLLSEVIDAVRTRLGPDRILALRLTCDENAPWAGITPAEAVGHVRAVAPTLDLLTVVRGGLFSPEKYRPDAHTEQGFNATLSRAMRDAAAGAVPVVLQGSVVDPAQAQGELDSGTCDAVEMTRAQIADPDLVAAVRHGRRPRPCVLSNQVCVGDDFRNPRLGCIGNPEAGQEGRAAAVHTGRVRDVLVVGGGPAGLEAARVLAERRHRVVLVERRERLGGAVHVASTGPGRPRFVHLTHWLEERCRHLGVEIRMGVELDRAGIAAAAASGKTVVLATGGRPRPPAFTVSAPGRYTTAAAVLEGPEPEPRRAVVWDPVGGPVAVAVAEHLAARSHDVHYATEDAIAGSRLAPAGDLVAANTRLGQAGIKRHLGTRVHSVDPDGVRLIHLVGEGPVLIPDAVLVDCSPLLPGDIARGPDIFEIGDRVAPRTVREAVLEAYEMASAL